MYRISGSGVLILGILLSGARGLIIDQNANCMTLATQENATQSFSPREGFIITYVSLLWCNENCDFSHDYNYSDFILILLGFALPAIIFSTVIPRRWRLDLPEQFFRVGHSRWLTTILKLALSLPAICIVAALDMVMWITCIMTFAGPMVFSGVQEMLLDYRGVRFLKGNVGIPAKEKLQMVVALLCGNFDQDVDDPTTKVHEAFIPSNLTEAALETAKSRLITIMNAQSSFGITIGIPAVFFLGGFLYNASQETPKGAVSFGIFWMVLVITTIVSGTLLAGNSPNTVSMLVINKHIKKRHPRLALWNDMYDSELYPVPMWDRGFSKYQWLRNTTLWQDPRCIQQRIFRDRIEIGRSSWGFITISTWLLVAIPCMLSWSLDYLQPWPSLGCLSLLYTIYITTQTWLIIAALVLARLDLPFHGVWWPLRLLSKGSSGSILLKSCSLVFTALTGVTIMIAALLTVIGSVVQFSGLFETCICSTPVSTWLGPASESHAHLSWQYTDLEYFNYVTLLNHSIYGSAASFACFVCFLGWWYQRSLRVALREVIESIEN